MTPEEYAAAAKAWREKNWNNGGTTATATTGDQNLANVYNSGVNPNKPVIPSEYIQGVLSQAQKDTAMQQGAASVGNVATVEAPQTQVSAASTSQTQDSGMGNAQNYINQLNDLRKNAAISALGKSRDNALSNLGQEKSAIQPKYYDQRNQVAAGAQQQARNFQEYMANRGGTSSGANAQAELSRNMTTQGNLGTLGRQETAAYGDIERRTSDVNNAYESDVSSATAGLEADKMQLLYQEFVRAEQRGDTLAQNAIQNEMAKAQLTGQFEGGQTLAAQGQSFNQNLATVQQQQNEANTKFAQQMQIDGVAYQKARDAISDKNYQKEFEINIKQQGFENALKIAVQQHQISTDNAQLAISRQNANTNAVQAATSAKNQANDNALQREKFEFEKSQSTQNPALSKELDGLYTGITSGQLSASAAIAEIDGKVKAGLTTQTEAAQMKQLISTITSSQSNVMPTLSQQQIEANGGSNPQDLNSAQLEKLWRTDSSGKAAGRPVIDWSQWYRDPRGRVGGISYDSWKQAYGPQLKAR